MEVKMAQSRVSVVLANNIKGLETKQLGQCQECPQCPSTTIALIKAV